MTETRKRADEHFHLPEPTIWPATLSAGIVLFTLGLVTNVLVVVAGIVLCITGFAGWVRDLLQEAHVTREQGGIGGESVEESNP